MKSMILKTLTMAVCCLSGFNVFAYDFEADGIYYLVNDNSAATVSVTYSTTSGNSYSGSVTIPSQVTADNVTYTVTCIGDSAFRRSTGLTSVSLPATVTELDKYAFYGCTGLTSVVLPDSLSYIGARVFYNCSSITALSIPSTVESIGAYAFYGCSGLTSITLPPTLTTIEERTFYKCSALVTIEIPSTVTSIGDYAFYYCTALPSIEIPDNVRSIGDCAFYYCYSLSSFTFPANVTAIPGQVLQNCTGLKSITIPSTVTEIGEKAFYGCTGLTSVTLPDGLLTLGEGITRGCTGLLSLKIPDQITEIPAYTCHGCTSLTTISFNSSITSIGKYAFYNCNNLEPFTVPETVTAIGSYAFYACLKFTSFQFPTQVTEVASYTFANCTALTSVYLPATVQTVGASAFKGCTALAEITSLNTTPPTVYSSSVFDSSIYSTAYVYVPQGYTSAYQSADVWSGFSNIAEISSNAADYTITTAAEWNALAELMAADSLDLTGKVVKIANDIDFNGDTIKPLGYDLVTLFNGELDGQGFTISGYKAVADNAYYGALATMTGSNAYIHDITVAGTFTTGYAFGGGVVGFLYGQMDNVTNSGSVTSVGAGLLGGVVGATASGAVITNCCNKGSVYSDSYNIGGVVGRAWMATVKNCWNEGSVSAEDTNFGGVIGVAYGSSSGGCLIDSCYNKGTVTYTGTSTTAYVAGVVSVVYNGQYSNCWNEGTVTSSSEAGYISGVFGYYYGTDSQHRTVFTNCYNTANLSGTTFVAGILNYGSSSNYPLIDMYECYNTGDITATSGRANGITNTYTPGGIYSGCYNSGTITATGEYSSGLFGHYRGTDPADTVTTLFAGCHNSGNVQSSGTNTAGVIAYVTKYTTVDSCYNTGNVTAGSYNVGGVVSFMSGSKTSLLSNLYNSGTIISTSTTTRAGAGGILGNGGTVDTLINVFNTGDVIAYSKNYTGGIAGYCAATIINAYNTGNVTGPAYVGGISGVKNATHGVITNAYNTGIVTATTEGTTNYGAITCGAGTANISNTFYLTSVATGSDYDTISVGLSYAELAKLELGDRWTAGDDYTYPRLTTLADNDYAKAHAAAVVPADGDSYSSITTGFNVGTPDGVTWTASSGSVEIDGNNVTFSESYSGTLTMTATSGDFSVATELTCNVVVSGIETLSEDDRTVVGEKFYTTSGAQVAEPTEGARAIYIVVKSYSDGTTEAVKEVR